MAQLRAAHGLGISYKRFQGWEPTPDDCVEWDEIERDWMLALAIYESSHKCPICGMNISFCHDQSAVEHTFSGAGVETCFVGEMREKAMHKYAESGVVQAPNSQTTKLKLQPLSNT